MAETVLDRFIVEYIFRTNKKALEDLERRTEKFRQNLEQTGRTLALIGAAATAAFGLAAKSSIDFETAFTGVRKTVTATEEEFKQLEATIRNMAKADVPINVNELARIAELAGQLGIETPAIEGFTKTIAQLASTTNIVGEQGAQDLARFANIVQMAQGKFGNLGSAIVALGNNFATTEAEMVDISLRLAAQGKLIGLTEAEILAMATALKSVGLESQQGGTAFSRIFAEMEKAAKSGGEELQVFNQIVGGDFRQMLEQDAAQAVVAFVNGMGEMIERGENVHPVLEQLGFDNVRIRDSLLRAAQAGDLMNNALALSTQAWEENVALTREADLRYGTAASRIQFAKNRLNDLAITVGDTLVPILIRLVGILEPVIDGANTLITRFPILAQIGAFLSVVLLGLGTTLLLVAGYLRLKAAAIMLWNLATTIAEFTTRRWSASLLLLRIQLLAMAFAQGIATAAQWALNVAMLANPVGLAIAAVVTLLSAY